MRIDTYTCDRCGTEAKGEGVPKFPQDWSRLAIELPWEKGTDRKIERDLCRGCTESVLHFFTRDFTEGSAPA